MEKKIRLANSTLAFGKTSQEVQAEGTPAWLAPHRTFEGKFGAEYQLAHDSSTDTLIRRYARAKEPAHGG
jgi:glucose-6-phosphate isomerase